MTDIAFIQGTSGNKLITADVHLGQYSDFNYSANSRLDQFDKLADRLIELGIENNCDELWILGDFLRVPNARSRIQHRLKRFIQKLCNHFKVVRYTLGNHDTDSKSDSQEFDDTIVTISEVTNFIYMDKKIMDFNGVKVAFANWTPSQDLTWFDGKVDILCGHYTKSNLFGQEIDEDKFDLMIHGDIHNHQVIGKFVSVGNPIQHDYSSQPDGTCVVLNPETKEWKHIWVDEDKTRFLRLYYTEESALEGFHGPLAYYKYMPPIQKELSDVGTKTIQWDDIDDLLTKITAQNELIDIHGEIQAGCPLDEEVDFNLQLLSLDIIGYRSIVKFHIDFNRNERVVLLGDNGSGKSSIIGALKGVFQKNSLLNYERSDLTEEQSVKITFVYQNKVIELTKGDSIGLVIDGEEQKYNNKSAFEADVLEKFPFIQYLDIFFISSGTSNLSNQLNPDRRIELISKFYRLDRIASYQKYAWDRYCEEWDKVEGLRKQLDNQSSVLTHVKNRLAELRDVDVTTQLELETRLQGYQDLRQQYDSFRDWKLHHEPLLSQKQELERSIANFNQRLAIDPRALQRRLDELEVDISKLDQLHSEAITRSNELKQLVELNQKQLARGIELKDKITELESGRCPECGSSIRSEKSNQLLDKYNQEIIQLRTDYDLTASKLESFTEEERKERYFITLISKIKQKLKSAQDEKMLLSNKLNQYKVAVSDLETYKERLRQVEILISHSEGQRPIEPKLPMNLSQLEDDLRSELAKIKSKLTEQDTQLMLEAELASLEQQIIRNDELAERYHTYSDLMSRTGQVMEEILKQLANKFSSNEVKYDVESGDYRGKHYINFNTYYRVRGKWRVYETLSDGQKQVCDLDFINRLFSVRVGLMVLDEYFRHLDDKNFPKCMELLMSMNVDTMILSTHDPNLALYTKRILLELNENGETISKII